MQSLGETGATYIVEVSLLNDEATLTLDTTGPGLNKRGYRTLVGEAQLKETLAAALLLLCRWQPEQPLLDPFCGTGTIPIEAALLARNKAPGLNRLFAAESWPAIPRQLWTDARVEANDAIRPGLPQVILGRDIDAEALQQARFHARQAGVEADVQFQQQDFTALSSRREFGLLLCNPPYGERLATRREAELLYRAMPAVFSRLPTWSFGVLTSHPRFERLVGRKADSRRKLYNGQIECWFHHYVGPQPNEQSSEPLFQPADDRARTRYQRQRAAGFTPAVPSPEIATSAGTSPAARRQQEMFANRLANRARHLRKWPQRGVTCLRLYDRDIPEIPLVIDRYEDCLHIVERPRPHDRTLNEHHRWLDTLVATAVETLGIAPENIFLKRYSDRRPPLAAAATATPTHVVHEAGLSYHVNLSEHLDTGLPLDLRTLRSMIRKLAAGKRFLGLFGNTGSLAVAAAAGDPVSTITVDPLDVHVHWMRQNLGLNGLAESEHQALCGSPGDYLQAAPTTPLDLVTIEDPTFREGAGREEPSTFQHQHAALIAAVLPRLAVEGTVFLVSHDRRFKPSSELSDCPWREITSQTLPEDFRNRRVHRVWRIVRR